MSGRFQAPKGTFDVLPSSEGRRAEIEQAAREVFAAAGYGRIETPAFEETELFSRGVGESTDIVRKEMFSFTDAGDRSLTLRPEGTAPISRAYLEHGMHRDPQPVRLWHLGPYFRQERPQAGRYRQFNQIGAEAIGSDSPLVDAESIALLHELLGRLGVPGVRLRLSSLGSPTTRGSYREELRDYLRANEGRLAPEVRERIDINPMRAFDSSDSGTQEIMSGAPTLLDRLEAEDVAHFEVVKRLLEGEGIDYELDPRLVRGLDYYTRTVFEFTCDRLGAQSGIGGGGRYDGLVAELGGRETPAVGWAAGIERILLALGEETEGPGRDVFVAAVADEDRERAFALTLELRRAGLSAEFDGAGRSMKGQMKQADRIGARVVAILEGSTASVRDMASGEQTEMPIGEVVGSLRAG